MTDPFANYDSWLERPFQDMLKGSEAFIDWADEAGYDVEDPLELLKAERAYQEYLEDQYDDLAEAQYEAAMDRKYDEMCDREYDSH